MNIFVNLDNKLMGLKKRAKRKKIKFNLDKEWLKEKETIEKCEATGIKFDTTMEPYVNPFYPTIDRIDSKKGYTKDNCQIVCNMFNVAKGEFDESVFEKWARAYALQYENKIGNNDDKI